jgi:hypothetical protein
MKKCGWKERRCRISRLQGESDRLKVVEYMPGCCAGDAWDELPNFCPYCGGKAKVMSRWTEN